MENSVDSELSRTTIGLDNYGINQLAETRKWTMFLSVVGFVFLGLMLFALVITLTVSKSIFPPGFSSVAMVPLLLLSMIYFFPIYFLFQFSKYSKLAIINTDTGLLSIALKYLKMHYRFMGIMLIIILIIYLLAGLVLVVTGKLFEIF